MNIGDLVKKLETRVGHHHLINGKKYICVSYHYWFTSTHHVSVMGAIPENTGALDTWTSMEPQWFIRAKELPRKAKDATSKGIVDSVPSTGQDQGSTQAPQ